VRALLQTGMASKDDSCAEIERG